jgi:integrase
MECVRLRVKDVDFAYHQLIVRDAKGAQDRVTMLPQSLEETLQRQLARTKLVHAEDLAAGYGEVYLPYAFARKDPHAGTSWEWQYVFPASKRSIDPRSGRERRHHVSETVLQKAVKHAIRQADLDKRGSCHTLRKVSPHYSSFVDSPYLLSPPSLLWANRRNHPVVTASDLG